MTYTTSKGHTIDTESQAYRDFLRGVELDAQRGDYAEPAPYRTLGDVIELEHRGREAAPEAAEQNAESRGTLALTRETVPA